MYQKTGVEKNGKKLIEKIIRKMKAELSEEQLSKLTAVCYEVIKET